MREFEEDNNDTFQMRKGTWRRVKATDWDRHGQEKEFRTALLVCPDCGQRSALTTHTIQDDGTVKPSVVCDCGFHDWAFLKGWNTSENQETTS